MHEVTEEQTERFSLHWLAEKLLGSFAGVDLDTKGELATHVAYSRAVCHLKEADAHQGEGVTAQPSLRSVIEAPLRKKCFQYEDEGSKRWHLRKIGFDML